MVPRGARYGNSMCLQRGFLPERSDIVRRPNTKPVQQDHVAINAFQGRLIAGLIIRQPRLSANSGGTDSPEARDYHSSKSSSSEQNDQKTRCFVEQGAANKDLVGIPNKIRIRTQHHSTSEVYGSRFQIVALSACLNKIATSR